MATPGGSPSKWDDVDLNNLSDDGGGDNEGEGTYRYPGEYRKTAPQYLPGRGVVRYSSALRHLIPVRARKKKRETLGVDEAGLFSFISFSWLSKYMMSAYKRGITADDIPDVPPSDSCDYNAQRLEVMWQDEMSVKGPKAASLKWVIWRFIRTRVFLSMFIISLNITTSFISVAFVMRWLLEFAENPDAPMLEGFKWAFLLGVTELFRIVFYAGAWAVSSRTAIRLRAACLTMLYRKIIRVHTLGDKTIGELVNMFASDSQRIYQMVIFGPMVISGPVSMGFGVLYILWLLSPWALAGMLVFLLFYPIQYGLSRLVGHFQAKVVAMSDKRIGLTSEILCCIKLIKMYAWEKSFAKSLFDLRQRELKFLQYAMYFQSLTISVASTVPIVTAIVMFLSHIGMGYNITPSQAFSMVCFCKRQLSTTMVFTSESWKHLFAGSIGIKRFQAFTSLAMLTSVLVPMWLCWSEACRSLYRGIPTLRRIKSVLLLNEISPYVAKPMDKSQAVCISNGTFSWDTPPPDRKTAKSSKKGGSFTLRGSLRAKKTQHIPANPEETTVLNSLPKIEPVLKDINFYVPKGSLIGVCGQVGAGKSSLLSAALGQLKMDCGKVSREGTCAYVSQQAWILNATLRENVLFGEAFNAKRYFYTLNCCALNEDINMLPGGDETEIGERGINLSGGQKQRVALARALYANRDIYFLDDPLSAVDAHVGAHIFNKYILEALQQKSVIFVTHQIQFLNRCDEVCVMKDGRIVERGTHEELLKQVGEYASMVQTWQQSQNNAANTAAIDSNVEVLGVNGECGEEKIVTNGKLEKEVPAQNGNTTTPGAGVLTQAEHIERGTLHPETFSSYMKAAGGVFVVMLVVGIIVLNVGVTAFSSWWLALWIKAGSGNSSITRTESFIVDNETLTRNVTVINPNLADNPDFEMYRTVYALTIVAIIATNLIRGLVYAKVSLKASRTLHSLLFDKVIKAPMQFFETTPMGRMQNLFSKDLDEVDSHLPFTLECMLEDACTLMFAILFICIVFPWFIVPLLILSLFFISVSRIFRVAVRDLKRLENTSRSPIFSSVSATVQGLSTIHAFGKENEFISKFTNTFDRNSTCLFMATSAVRWLALRIDAMNVVMILITAILSVLLHNQVPPAMTGLAIAYAASISGIFQYVIRMVAEAETRLISVERITSYLQNLKTEGGTGPKGKPWQGWPQRGTIHFNKINLQYRSSLPTVLKDVSFKVKDTEKLGIVGRTGSGKSSLTTALFRLVEFSGGSVEIDQLNISSLDLEQLRTQLTIIPQDPVLFSGSVRSNLDPWNSCDDARLWDVLEKTQMKEKVQAMTNKLDGKVGYGGDNLSVGERQLLCLARALLRKTKILILDEATAAVDPDTEAAIHRVIQDEFRDCTVLTIAHRISTVLGCDRVLVMEQGEVAELDKPSKLLDSPQSKLSQLMAATKETNS
ncbi:ATP-binding cassette sub-family C member 5-like isoform X5 [Macrosteles quadrilineatus]|uniref:ATP-binding cassette sub-family C member 5-like isoform X5 n=1 Tax=Macrosteles quadrilineatus TaxID=74068 RepID=UPI0023E35065|nr:ATP-binding cassette sub-family C member 5-like isoform X5 [Macrosteles quadrilineatus]